MWLKYSLEDHEVAKQSSLPDEFYALSYSSQCWLFVGRTFESTTQATKDEWIHLREEIS